MQPLLTFALLIGFASAAPVPKELKKKDDAALIVGTWNAVMLNGKPQSVGEYTFVFDAAGVQHRFGKGTVSDWIWTIDQTETPKRMKWVTTKTRDTTWQCVYELSGDSLKIAFVPSDQPIPAVVQPTPGLTVYELTRDTPAK